MASDSEGLRQPCHCGPEAAYEWCRKWLPIRKGYDEIVATSVSFIVSRKWLPIRKGYDHRLFSYPPDPKSKMASDSEGLRPLIFTETVVASESKMASDSEGLRHSFTTLDFYRIPCRKWLPIRKGYD